LGIARSICCAAVLKAAIFDFGGVLTTPVWDSFAAFCRDQGLDEATVRDLFRRDPEALADLRELEMGRMREEEFERRFAERLGLPDGDGLIESLFRGMRPADEMLEAVRVARAAGIRTGLLSNSWSTSHYDRDLLRELFDDAVISGEVGMHKPQQQIYRLAAERLGVEPADCAFVDDLRDNCAGAEAVGMTAVLHRDATETIERLSGLLGVPLDRS
jgi:epoxide hydrolase-like predicted phosphatase